MSYASIKDLPDAVRNVLPTHEPMHKKFTVQAIAMLTRTTVAIRLNGYMSYFLSADSFSEIKKFRCSMIPLSFNGAESRVSLLASKHIYCS